MKALRTGIALTAVAAMLAVAPAPLAAEFVPPENSAANQYTESFPTAGGNHNTEKGGSKGHRSPTEALGSGNAHRLQQKGQDGQAAAELAAATTPTEPARHGKSGRVAPATAAGEPPNVNSGLSEVIGQATGTSSSGDIGWLLPLVIAAAAAWSLAFFWRRRRRTA